MKNFTRLLEIADTLLGPSGCPWDREQTFFSLQPFLLEEVHELIDAIDMEDGQKIMEEMGDLLYSIVFLAKLGEKNSIFTTNDVINSISEKLIRRHPHVFGEIDTDDLAEIEKNWEKIKVQETDHADRKSKLDGIPERLPLLLRAQKILQRMRRAGKPLYPAPQAYQSEDELGDDLLKILSKAETSGLDVESALRRMLNKNEKEFRSEEQSQNLSKENS